MFYKIYSAKFKYDTNDYTSRSCLRKRATVLSRRGEKTKIEDPINLIYEGEDRREAYEKYAEACELCETRSYGECVEYDAVALFRRDDYDPDYDDLITSYVAPSEEIQDDGYGNNAIMICYRDGCYFDVSEFFDAEDWEKTPDSIKCKAINLLLEKDDIGFVVGEAKTLFFEFGSAGEEEAELTFEDYKKRCESEYIEGADNLVLFSCVDMDNWFEDYDGYGQTNENLTQSFVAPITEIIKEELR